MEKDVSKGNIGTKEAKDAELDEMPKPVRKAGNTAVPEADETSEKKRKGQRKVG
jgi:hypothetical protein